MASSNRHWPSMFKSKPANHHQWQRDINPPLVSNGCHRPSYTSSVGGCEEQRSPEPKPRWNPKPEQIRILEAIFNSGMVNPPRDEIRKIRAQLQEYGQVGDANVFYWFQNRKSRSKHKLRHLNNSPNNSSSKQQLIAAAPVTNVTTSTLNMINIAAAAPSSSSSSSEKSSPQNKGSFSSMGFSSNLDVSINSPTASVNQSVSNFFQPHHNQMLPESGFFFPVHHQAAGVNNPSFTQGFCFSELTNVVHDQTDNIGPCTSLLLNEIINHGSTAVTPPRKEYRQEDHHGMKGMKLNMDPHQLLNYNVNIMTSSSPTSHSATNVGSHTTTGVATVAVPSPMNLNIEGGVGEAGAMAPVGAAKSTVFINDVAFEVGAGPFNVREAFGDDAVLIHSSGQPVLTNEWGLTLHSLHHGSFYYLV